MDVFVIFIVLFVAILYIYEPPAVRHKREARDRRLRYIAKHGGDENDTGEYYD